LLSQELIEKDDVIVNLYGVPDSGYFDSIRLTYMQHEFDFPFTFERSKLPKGLGQHVLTRVLQIAGELATEGREGKPVGTLFVLGDYEKVKPYTKQLIVNPFAGYGESQRNILDPAIEETVKEYAKIDGAFLLRGDGVLMSAGTFIAGEPQAEELQSGLGARHAAALGITAVTEALAIVISESTRKVSIFHGGKRIVFM
jgi:DNA integrity scanning protein DisA with diadenylate cyclase activity